MFDQSDSLKHITDHVFNDPPVYKIETTAVGWQRCPICSGTGRLTPIGVSSATFETCDMCNGKKIINTATGKPPAY